MFGFQPGEDVAGEDYVDNLRKEMDEVYENLIHNIRYASWRWLEIQLISIQTGESCLAGRNCQDCQRRQVDQTKLCTSTDWLRLLHIKEKLKWGNSLCYRMNTRSHSVASDLRMVWWSAKNFKSMFGQVDDLKIWNVRFGQRLDCFLHQTSQCKRGVHCRFIYGPGGKDES